MTRQLLFYLLLLPLGTALSSMAQPEFKATLTTMQMAEGGSDDIMLVETDNERFAITIPKGYGSQVRPDLRSVILTSSNGGSAISVRFTTNYAGWLPKQEVLGDSVAANHPRASLVSSSTARTDLGPSQAFDLFQPAGSDLMLRIRDVYVAYPLGSVELTFSCNSANFEKEKFGFARLLYSFRSLPKGTIINP